MVLDGLSALRHARCAVPGCEEDLQNYNADRCGMWCHAGVNATPMLRVVTFIVPSPHIAVRGVVLLAHVTHLRTLEVFLDMRVPQEEQFGPDY